MSQHRARKRFGQNFLHDGNVIDQIIDAIYPHKSQRVVEIGPGLGALTFPLLKLTKSLDVIEIDRDLVAYLHKHQPANHALTIHNCDALKVDLKKQLQLKNDERVRLVGNLPYNISTPLIFHLISQIDHVQDMHFMLQKEVVDRMTAPPGSKTYGRLSVMLAYSCQAESLFRVGPGSFDPAPKVDSAIVRLIPHPQAPFAIGSPERFADIVQTAFGQRRKTLRNNLKTLLDETAITAAGVNPQARPEQISPAEFGQLSLV